MVSAVSWLLDTNIISEAMRPRPDVAVMENLARYDGELAIPAPVWHELRYGWLRMPDGQQKDAVGRFVQDVLGTLPILPYDGAAARIQSSVSHASGLDSHCHSWMDRLHRLRWRTG